MNEKEYLGDGVYALGDKYGSVILTTEDGVKATNRIVLEPEVFAALLKFVAVYERRRTCFHDRLDLDRCADCGQVFERREQ